MSGERLIGQMREQEEFIRKCEAEVLEAKEELKARKEVYEAAVLRLRKLASEGEGLPFPEEG